ncbi:MAG: cation-translocating P-type ATPase [Peptococcaceae bacterium]|nr:cation-translocating P-type ATPase [Peptococcaceae bacterium]
MPNSIWHTSSQEDICSLLEVQPEYGLDEHEVTHRLLEIGHNVLVEKKKINPAFIFFGQFKDFMVMVLVGATLVSGLLGEFADAITIMAIIFLNAVLGFIQEFRAEKSMESLRGMTAPEALVRREKRELRVPAAELVPGDVVMVEAGDRIPADIRWLHTINVKVEESALTGESIPVEKHERILEDEFLPLGDRKNLGFMGTIIVHGRGSGVVVETGMDTEMGTIAGMLQQVEEEETPLQRRLAELGKWLVALSVGACLVVMLVGLFQGEGFSKMFMAGVSLAVAAIPEGLPAIVTVALAIGVQRMVKRHAVIRHLPAVETLGCATVICSDKTGTLTQNEMTVRRIYCNRKHITVGGEGYDPKGSFEGADPYSRQETPLQELLKSAALCNNAVLTRKGSRLGLFRDRKDKKSTWSIEGDPTEGALLVAAAKAGIWREEMERDEDRIAEIPFDSERKRMTVVYRHKKEWVVHAKGAVDVMLDSCQWELTQKGVVDLTQERRRQIIQINNDMARQALRVLVIAQRRFAEEDLAHNAGAQESDLVFLGLVGMIDPPRASAKKAIQVCKTAGIKPVMITGDHKLTAQAVAKELGIFDGDSAVLTGPELNRMSDGDLAHRIMDLQVFARVAPQDKIRIVRAFKANGEIVAMTGDGVNDAPAVKEADIGIAMGQSGTDVTKEASDMVIVDDNFATIVAAVEEGRGIYDNIRKFIRYLMACNLGEVLTMFIGVLVGLPLPLLAIQILWVNLVTDGLPAIALGLEKAEENTMRRPPRDPRESIFGRGLGKMVAIRGIMIGLCTLTVFVIALWYGFDLLTARTMAFTTLVMAQLCHVFECRSENKGIFEINLFSNLWLVSAVAVSFAMQIAVLYHPFLQEAFKTSALGSWQWVLILIASAGPTLVYGVYRLIRNSASSGHRGRHLLEAQRIGVRD